MENYVIVYDIANDRRRQKIFKIMKDYAIRVQYSVFEATLSQKDLIMLQRKLEKIINKNEDSIIFYYQNKISLNKNIKIGKQINILDEEDWYFV